MLISIFTWNDIGEVETSWLSIANFWHNVYKKKSHQDFLCSVKKSRKKYCLFLVFHLAYTFIVPTVHGLKMKKWFSQWTQFMQLRKEVWEKFKFFTGFFTQLHKLRSLRRSFLHFHFISAVHIWFISYIINSSWISMKKWSIFQLGWTVLSTIISSNSLARQESTRSLLYIFVFFFFILLWLLLLLLTSQ